ncbi:proteasome subunit alpha, partial [Halobacteriales archaeon QH_3_68_24]
IREYLEEHYEEGMDLDAGVGLALEALASVNNDKLSPEGIGVATISVEDEQFRKLSDEETEEHLAELDLLGSEDDEEETEE